jgi:hypothetical protein
MASIEWRLLNRQALSCRRVQRLTRSCGTRAAGASAAYSVSNDDNRAAIDLDPKERPPIRVPSAALRALRLPPWATVKQVEAAYHENLAERVAQGAEEAEFHRLAKNHERALRFVRAPTPAPPVDLASP